MKVLSYTFEIGAILSPSMLTNEILNNKPYHYYMVVSCLPQYIANCYEKNGSIAFLLTDGTNELEIIPPKSGSYLIKNVSFKHKNPSRLSVIVKYTCVFPDGSELKRENEFSGIGLYFNFVKKKKFRIEYIGQSYANDGHRTAQERLSSHATLQKILEDYRCTSDLREVMLILLGADISPIDNSTITGTPSPFVMIGNTNHPDYVNLLEACLINQFKPKYNVMYKKSVVPTSKHKTYNEVLKENYDAFSINVALYGSKNDYILYTDAKTIEVNEGVLLNQDRLYIDFKEAIVIDENKFTYSFFDYVNEIK